MHDIKCKCDFLMLYAMAIEKNTQIKLKKCI